MEGDHQSTTTTIRPKYRRKESMNKRAIERGVVQRQWEILAVLRTSNQTIADLASQFHMSTKSIHRDIAAMIAAGLPIGYYGRYVFAKDQNQNKENNSMTKSLEIRAKREKTACKYG